jgi:quercetin dioxygenase-like cupin family protein
MAASGVMVANVMGERQEPTAVRVYQNHGGTTLRVLLDQAGLGGTEVEVGEITLLPNSDSGDHQHAVTEVLYVLEGELEHVVNGRSMKLSPGMVASARPTDTVRHRTGAFGAKVLVIWAPGGEVARVTARWRAQ